MATFFDNSGSGAMDQLLESIRTGVNEIRLLETYTQGDDWSTVNGNTISTVAVTTGNFDTPQDAGTLARRLTFTGASDPSSANGSTGSPNLHIALVDSGSTKTVAVTNETSNQPITQGNPITYPSFFLQVSQPGQV